MYVMIPEDLKTTTDKIAWLGDNIRSCILALKAAEGAKAEAVTKLEMYERLLETVMKGKI